MTERRTLPYGAWPSPISAEMLVTGASRVSEVVASGGVTWWLEQRPSDEGRSQIVRRDGDGSRSDVMPVGWNVRTLVHEYGGGAWWLDGETVFAVSWDDQRLYRLDPGGEPVALTPVPLLPRSLRYADGRVCPDGETVVCVRESHPPLLAGGSVDVDRVVNEIVAMPARPGGGDPVVLVAGHDFVAAPRISPDGRRLAWLTWEHPDMPWDSTVLWVGELGGSGTGTTLSGARQVAGGPGESVVQPVWGADGSLFAVSDRSQWWNVYRIDGIGPGGAPSMVPVHPVEADVVGPAWYLGLTEYAVAADGTVWFAHADGAGARLVAVAPDGGVSDTPVTVGGTRARRVTRLVADEGRVVALVSQPTAEPALVGFPVTAGAPGPAQVLRAPRDLGLDPAGISVPEHVTFPSEGGREAHAWFYPPASAVAAGPAGEAPPLVVHVHGGPTGAADPSFSLRIQYWTSRGIAVADVDHGGSTGYGRAFRRLLNGGWGVVDVDDTCAAARWLADRGVVDPARTAVSGGSAGGFTVLNCLATRDVFAAGANHFGISDLAVLAKDTHKFESRYDGTLVGAAYDEDPGLFAERSPITHVDGFDRPLIVLQGAEDAVVPPTQSELIVAALREKGVPHAYLLFEGEQHGFRRAGNIVRALTAELYFFSRCFGFVPAGDVEPVPITFGEKLPAQG